MSYDEYKDLFDKAQQKDTKYVAFVFDIKGSKKLPDKERYIAQIKTYETINLLTKKLKMIEKVYNKQILIEDPLLPIIDDIKKRPKHTILSNPCFINGDCFAFFCYNHSISTDLFKGLFNLCAEQVDNKYAYHFATGKFETLDYGKGSKEYYAGYIIQQLTEGKKFEQNDELIETK